MNQQANRPQASANTNVSRGQKLAHTLGSLEQRRAELAAVLPLDLTFEEFHATVNQALRANPDLLDCEPRSLLNACIKAGYDGLRVDGKEACIVWEMGTLVKNGPKVKLARYMSMYQGLVQQVLRGGLVLSCEADVIYENDDYKVLRGTNAGIYHEPLLVGDRGKMIAVYNVATLPSGHKTFAYLTAEQVIDIQKESKSGWKDGAPNGVWKRWPREQWKKTAIRQHRKTLPVGTKNKIRDVDMQDDFPQFAAQPMSAGLLGAPRPARGGARQLGHDPMGNGVPLDLTGDQPETVEAERGDDRAEQNGRQQQKAAAEPKEQKQQGTAQVSDIPANAVEWASWGRSIGTKLVNLTSADDVNAYWADESDRLEAAPDDMRERVKQQFTDRLTDLVSGGSDGAAPVETNTSSAAGEDDD